MDGSISVPKLVQERSRGFGPQVLDVRRKPAYEAATKAIPGAIRTDPDRISSWWHGLDLARPILAYCVHGHDVSQGVASFLRDRGYPASHLDGGYEAWVEAGQTVAAKPGTPSVWVTRARPKVDRIACPWLIRRFVDPSARILFVPAEQVKSVADDVAGEPFDVPGARFGHLGEHCSFDAFVRHFDLSDPALLRVAEAVRGAAMDRLDLAPEAAGLFAISRGLSINIDEDEEQLRHGMVVYDALYASFRHGR